MVAALACHQFINVRRFNLKGTQKSKLSMKLLLDYLQLVDSNKLSQTWINLKSSRKRQQHLNCGYCLWLLKYMTQYIPPRWGWGGARVQLLWLVPEIVLCVATQNSRAIFANKNSSFLLTSDNTWNMNMNTTGMCCCWELDWSMSLCQQISSSGMAVTRGWSDLIPDTGPGPHGHPYTPAITIRSSATKRGTVGIIVIKFISVVTIVDKGIVVTRTVTAKHDLGQDIHC